MDIVHISSEHPDHLLIEGTLHHGNVEEIVERLTAIPRPRESYLEIDFAQSPIKDGLALLIIKNTLEALAARVHRLTVYNAPESLERHLRQSIAQGLANLELVPDLVESMAE
ncbi:MAG: hypothetical protein OEZ47_16795 [Gammaproteobacteria bacterium]|nr:hypothetical protein [Gammaproteobacteria bacterium]